MALAGVLQVLGREERSLASLLSELCGVHKQKQHQRADWRQRCVTTCLLCRYLESQSCTYAALALCLM